MIFDIKRRLYGFRCLSGIEVGEVHLIPILALFIFFVVGCGGNYGRESDREKEDAGVYDVTIDRYGVSAYLLTQHYQGTALVFEKDSVIFSGGFGYANHSDGVVNAADVSFRLGSISKQFTAMAILMLQEEGLLTVEDSVAAHLSDYPGGDKIRLKDLLGHTSGIPNYTELDFYPSIVERSHEISDIVGFFKNLPLDFEPGSKFAYSNSGYVVLGSIIESVTGSSYSEYLRNKIFIPLGMLQSGYLDIEERNIELAVGYLDDYKRSPFIDPTIPNADGGLVSSVGDLLRWHKALRDNLLVSEDTKKIMFSPHIENVAFGWFVGQYYGTPVYYHGGGYSGFRSGIYRYPVQDRLIVLLSNNENIDINSLARGIDELISE